MYCFFCIANTQSDADPDNNNNNNKSSASSNTTPRYGSSNSISGDSNNTSSSFLLAAPSGNRRNSVATGKSFKLVNSKTEVYTVNDPPSGDSINSTDPASKVLVILLTNSLGLKSENNLKLADRYAQALNTTVVVPDLFDGDPVSNIIDPSDLAVPAVAAAGSGSKPSPAGVKIGEEVGTFSLIGKVKLMVASTVKGFFDDMWTAKHSFETTNRRLAQTLHELVTETYKPDKVVLVGYSFGAKYVLHYLKKTRGNSAVADKVVCATCVHPSLLETTDFEAVQTPLYFVYARHDDLLPEDLIRKCLEVHEDKNGTSVKIETAVYDNQDEQKRAASEQEVLPLPHGFAVPGDYPKSVVGDRPDKVFNVLTSWIREHL